jgi:hypothetical protein
MKEQFRQTIDDFRFKTPYLNLIVNELISYIPDYFWTVPASITGKYHPPDSLGEGGLVRHTLKMTQMGLKMAEGDTTINPDEVFIACMFHDIAKYGDKPEVSNDKERYWFKRHPEVARGILEQFFEDYVYINNNNHNCYIYDGKLMLDRSEYLNIGLKWRNICQAIHSHYGKWGVDNGMPLPKSRLDFIVSHADLVSSMSDIVSLKYYKGE